MSGVTLVLDADDVTRLTLRLEQWSRQVQLRPVLDAVGAEVESQTRRRIEDEQTSPDGEPWEPWSERYALTRHGQQQLLQDSGDLIDSLAFQVHPRAVEIGTPLIYGATHQRGRGAIPPRPFLGLSNANSQAVLDVVEAWLDTQLKKLS